MGDHLKRSRSRSWSTIRTRPAEPSPTGLAGDSNPATSELSEGEAAPTEGRNDFGSNGYRGPCPPPGHGPHWYIFRLNALDAQLGVASGADKAELEQALSDHVLATAELRGTYER